MSIPHCRLGSVWSLHNGGECSFGSLFCLFLESFLQEESLHLRYTYYRVDGVDSVSSSTGWPEMWLQSFAVKFRECVCVCPQAVMVSLCVFPFNDAAADRGK